MASVGENVMAQVRLEPVGCYGVELVFLNGRCVGRLAPGVGDRVVYASVYRNPERANARVEQLRNNYVVELVAHPVIDAGVFEYKEEGGAMAAWRRGIEAVLIAHDMLLDGVLVQGVQSWRRR